MPVRPMLFAVAVAFATAPVQAADRDNPEYQNWSRFKAGTAVTLRSVTDSDGQKSTMDVTTTLVDVGPEKLTLDMTSVSKAGEQEFKSPPYRREVPRRVPDVPLKLADGVTPKGRPGDPLGTADEGTEQVTVPAGAFATKWTLSRSSAYGSDIESKSWICDDVPGRAVRSESRVVTEKTATAKRSVAVTTMELVEVKQP